MLSILIPIYNFSVVPLVTALYAQARTLGVDWEIRCYDDGSTLQYREWHRQLTDWPGVEYAEMPTNLGRAAIRNRLAQDARFPYLLFLDNDGGIIRTDFLATYIAALAPDIVLYGGREYSTTKPTDPALVLHWTYGHKREALPLAQREKKPYASFMTNNFCVPRDLMLALPFDANLQGYGHEDTLFGLALEKRDIPILHLDNPVEHLGLEPASLFLRKQKEALQNLRYLQERYPDFSTRLLDWEGRLRVSPLHWLPIRAAHRLLPALERQLRSQTPQMRLLDIWKLLQLQE